MVPGVCLRREHSRMLKNSSQLPGSKQGQSCKVVFENSNFVRQRDSRESAADLPRRAVASVGERG